MMQSLPGHQVTLQYSLPSKALIEAPILHYPDPLKFYIVDTDVSDYACEA